MPYHLNSNPSVILQAMKHAETRTLLQLRTEIVALKALRHPNILELFHVEINAVYLKKSGVQVRVLLSGEWDFCAYVLPLIVGCGNDTSMGIHLGRGRSVHLSIHASH